MTFSGYASLYRNNLLNDVMPFWLKHSIDSEHGGFLTCLDQHGKVYDTDKFVWLQGREIWTFSMLFNQVEKKPDWLAAALQGAEFLLKHGRDEGGNWYFSLTRKGEPLVQPYNIFSDCFVCIGFAQLYQATNDKRFADVALSTFERILSRRHDPKGPWSKAMGGTRPLKNFALPMILCNLVLEIESLLDPSLVGQVIGEGVHEVMNVFFDPVSGLVRENVDPLGGFSDSFDGRLINPGHGIEAMWFLMDLAKKTNNEALVEKAKNVTLQTLQYGWDEKYGGIFYFLDSKGHPPQQLEWDQKLWWVHIESLVSLIKGYQMTGDPKCLNWFERVHDYTWSHFPDPVQGEWFGYLDRRGDVLLPLKGGKWKGCFHVPRGLYQLWKTMELLGNGNESIK